MSSTGPPATPGPGSDRRVNAKLRELFEEAYELIHPFFDPNHSWGGHSLDHLAFRVLRERFPQLARHEVEEMVAAARRVWTERHLPDGRHPFRR